MGEGWKQTELPKPRGYIKVVYFVAQPGRDLHFPAKLVTKLECRRKLRCREDGD